jgi:peptidylprolyl isomerase
MQAANTGDRVRVHYTGKLDDGSIFDSSEGGDPLEFRLGGGEVIPGFEQAVAGMAPGDERRVTIPAGEAYGPRREDLVLVVRRQELPEEMQPEVGLQLQMSQDGQQFVVTISDVTEEDVVLDANHPLAGEDLTFELKLVDIG